MSLNTKNIKNNQIFITHPIIPPCLEWESYEISDDCCISFPSSSEPYINWKHVDGPMLVCRDGSIKWLTYWDRFCFKFGFTTLSKLDMKYGSYTKQKRIQ